MLETEKGFVMCRGANPVESTLPLLPVEEQSAEQQVGGPSAAALASRVQRVAAVHFVGSDCRCGGGEAECGASRGAPREARIWCTGSGAQRNTCSALLLSLPNLSLPCPPLLQAEAVEEAATAALEAAAAVAAKLLAKLEQ